MLLMFLYLFFTFAELIGSDSESVMLSEIATAQEEYRSALGIVFENFDSASVPKKFRYKFRTSYRLPENLYENVENGSSSTDTFAHTPFPSIQMCLDRAYIGEAAPLSTINITVN